MFLNYLISELLLVFKRWKLFVINIVYFGVPILFFQIIFSSEINKNNEHFFEIISNGIFLVVFVAVIQFFIFNKINNEYNSGITATKFCLPLSPSNWIIIDLLAENLFGIILFGCCLFFHCLVAKTESFQKLIICGIILIPVCVSIAHAYALLFLTSNENIIISSIVSLFSFFPLLFFIGNIIKNINYTQNIVIALLYSIFISIIYVARMALNINSISL